MSTTNVRGSIEYLVGDATAPEGEGPFVVAHVVNDLGGWGRGFVLAVSRRWKEPERAYRDLARRGLVLGTTQLVAVTPQITVANMVAQHGYASASNPTALDYEALAACLASLDSLATASAGIVMPRIGTKLAGGRWADVEPLVVRELVARGRHVRVYDLPR